jgi:hypothetical protein
MTSLEVAKISLDLVIVFGVKIDFAKQIHNFHLVEALILLADVF